MDTIGRLQNPNSNGTKDVLWTNRTCTKGRATQGSVPQPPKTRRKLNSYCYEKGGNLEGPPYHWPLKGYCVHDDSQMNVLENRTMEIEKGLSKWQGLQKGGVGRVQGFGGSVYVH